MQSTQFRKDFPEKSDNFCDLSLYNNVEIVQWYKGIQSLSDCCLKSK